MQKDVQRFRGQKPAAPPTTLPVADKPARASRPAPPKPVSPPRDKPRPKRLKRPSRDKRSAQALIGAGVIVGVLLAGGILYWWRYMRPEPPVSETHYACQQEMCLEIEGEGVDACLIDADCQAREPEIPLSLIEVDDTITIEIYMGGEAALPARLKQAADDGVATGELERVLIKTISGLERKYMSLSLVTNYLELQIPHGISQAISVAGNYTLFLCGQPEGSRLGLALKLERTDVQDLLQAWEPTMIDDMSALLLQDARPTPASEEFQDGEYRGIPIRYVNFPNPDLSIDYVMIGNMLVITSSRGSMYQAIDALLGS